MRFRFPGQRREAEERALAESKAFIGQGLPAARPESPSCELHGWGYGDGVRPKPPASACPECLADVLRRRATERPTLVVPSHPFDVKETAQLALASAKHEEKLAASGHVLPGSELEQVAIEYMDDQRRRSGRRRPDYVSYDGTRRYTRRHRPKRRQDPSWPMLLRHTRLGPKPQLFELYDEEGNTVGYANEEGRQVG